MRRTRSATRRFRSSAGSPAIGAVPNRYSRAAFDGRRLFPSSPCSSLLPWGSSDGTGGGPVSGRSGTSRRTPPVFGVTPGRAVTPFYRATAELRSGPSSQGRPYEPLTTTSVAVRAFSPRGPRLRDASCLSSSRETGGRPPPVGLARRPPPVRTTEWVSERSKSRLRRVERRLHRLDGPRVHGPWVRSRSRTYRRGRRESRSPVGRPPRPRTAPPVPPRSVRAASGTLTSTGVRPPTLGKGRSAPGGRRETKALEARHVRG